MSCIHCKKKKTVTVAKSVDRLNCSVDQSNIDQLNNFKIDNFEFERQRKKEEEFRYTNGANIYFQKGYD